MRGGECEEGKECEEGSVRRVDKTGGGKGVRRGEEREEMRRVRRCVQERRKVKGEDYLRNTGRVNME